jgi:hypothetical protein
MILVRNTFQLKFGKAKEAKAMVKDGLAIANAAGIKNNRVCLDITGPFYTFVLENTYDSLSDFESTMSEMTKNAEWQKWYASFIQLVESGHREMYTIVE